MDIKNNPNEGTNFDNQSSSSTNFSNEKEPVGTTGHSTEKPLGNKNTSGNRIVNFLKNNVLAVILFILLIITFAWLTVKNSNQEKQFLQEKTELVTNYKNTVSTYENKIDNLKVDYIKFATEVFSWSVRSELLRNNVENLNQLVSVFVKESNVSLVQIIDPSKKKIILSSDKKYEGEPYTENVDNSNTQTIVRKNKEGKSQIITPVMGFNSKIGILIVTL